ncbi:uncharacterized protein LOC126808693 [Patella vulgata]|uniref:uncharacterized protein LOC126808693 n=1 Tax=Patella vulgata TaxID=6465 RepID=UPI0024A8DAB0|nr:uncharacterized protein LOC126808693 [Patella vulgata]
MDKPVPSPYPDDLDRGEEQNLYKKRTYDPNEYPTTRENRSYGNIPYEASDSAYYSTTGYPPYQHFPSSYGADPQQRAMLDPNPPDINPLMIRPTLSPYRQPYYDYTNPVYNSSEQPSEEYGLSAQAYRHGRPENYYTKERYPMDHGVPSTDRNYGVRETILNTPSGSMDLRNTHLPPSTVDFHNQSSPKSQTDGNSFRDMQSGYNQSTDNPGFAYGQQEIMRGESRTEMGREDSRMEIPREEKRTSRFIDSDALDLRKTDNVGEYENPALYDSQRPRIHKMTAEHSEDLQNVQSEKTQNQDPKSMSPISLNPETGKARNSMATNLGIEEFPSILPKTDSFMKRDSRYGQPMKRESDANLITAGTVKGTIDRMSDKPHSESSIGDEAEEKTKEKGDESRSSSVNKDVEQPTGATKLPETKPNSSSEADLKMDEKNEQTLKKTGREETEELDTTGSSSSKEGNSDEKMDDSADETKDGENSEDEGCKKNDGHNFICGYCEEVFLEKKLLISHKCPSVPDDLDDEIDEKDDMEIQDGESNGSKRKEHDLNGGSPNKKSKSTDNSESEDEDELSEKEDDSSDNSGEELEKNEEESVEAEKKEIKKETNTTSTDVRRSARKNKAKAKMREWIEEEDEEDPYICGECGQTFDKEHLLLKHMKHHNNSDYEDYDDSEESAEKVRTRTSSRISTRPKRKAAMRRISYEENAIARESLRRSKRSLSVKYESNDEWTEDKSSRKSKTPPKPPTTKIKPTGCPVCGEVFRVQEELKDHLLGHCEEMYPEKKPLPCQYCDKLYTEENFLEKHEEVHILNGDIKIERVAPVKKSAKKDKYMCSVCSKLFDLKSQLKIHEKSHREKKYKCPHCDEEFKVKSDYMAHKKTHKLKHEYKCEFCGKDYAFKSGLTIHLKSHLERQTFDCITCNRSFFSAGHLAIHQKGHKHAGTKKHRCQECGYQVYDEEKLFRHLESHINQEPYVCPFCGKLFMKKSTFVKHKKKHSGENMCDVCGKAFSHRSGLDRHYTIHSGEKPYKCEFCDKSFSQQSNLTTHSRQHSGEKPFMCDVCAQSFTNKCSLVRHMTKHSENEAQLAGVTMLNRNWAWEMDTKHEYSANLDVKHDYGPLPPLPGKHDFGPLPPLPPKHDYGGI